MCSNPPVVIVNGYRIQTAPPIRELLDVIGKPTRVDTGPTPAPLRHRNNQQHVFDSLGIKVNEHHYTRRAHEIYIALSVEERLYGFSPLSAFAGELIFDGVNMQLRATESDFLRAMPWPIEHFIAGNWNSRFDGFFVAFQAIGPKLPSGRRSKRRVMVNVSISWPHDPNGEPPSTG